MEFTSRQGLFCILDFSIVCSFLLYFHSTNQAPYILYLFPSESPILGKYYLLFHIKRPERHKICKFVSFEPISILFAKILYLFCCNLPDGNNFEIIFFHRISANLYDKVISPSLTQPSFLTTMLMSGQRTAGSTNEMSISPTQSIAVTAVLLPASISFIHPVYTPI